MFAKSRVYKVLLYDEAVEKMGDKNYLHIIIYILDLMDSAKLSVSSLRHIGDMDEVKKADRYYLRYYLTIKRARKLN